MANNIDTEKYEGHTDDFIWTWKQYASHLDPSNHADRALIQDAPLLLAEVKRLSRVLHAVVVDLTVTNIGGPDSQGAAVKAALNTLSEVIDVD